MQNHLYFFIGIMVDFVYWLTLFSQSKLFWVIFTMNIMESYFSIENNSTLKLQWVLHPHTKMARIWLPYKTGQNLPPYRELHPPIPKCPNFDAPPPIQKYQTLTPQYRNFYPHIKQNFNWDNPYDLMHYHEH